MTRTAIFDIETDGLLDQLTVIHSLCIRILETGETYSCTDQAADLPISYNSIREGIRILSEADTLVGHNIIKFDLPALRKVYPDFTYKADLFDTLVAARVIFPDIREIDFARRASIEAKEGTVQRDRKWPSHIIGRQSLDSWGIRLGEWKGDYFKAKTQELRDKFDAAYRAARAKGLKVVDCPPKAPTICR
jgi:DNA polymerase III alpha subunit (gram-positive type)